MKKNKKSRKARRYGPFGHAATIEVSGTGKVTAEPDVATVTLGVTARKEVAQDAMDEVSRKVRAILAQFSARGIEDRDVTTERLRLNEENRGDVRRRKQKDAEKTQPFGARNTISCKVRHLEDLGQIVQAALDAGANTVSNVAFSVEDPCALMAQARSAAAADALARARLYAEGAGVTLGRVVSIREGQDRGRSRHYDTDAILSMNLSMDFASEEVPISAGTLDYSADVSMTCEIAD